MVAASLPNATGQAERRKQIDLGDADLRALRRGIQLGRADVRATAIRSAGMPTNDLRRRRRESPVSRAQQRSKRLRRHAEQHAKRISPCCNDPPQLRDRRFRLRQHILGLEHIESGRRATVEAVRAICSAFLLLARRSRARCDLLLQRADADIGRRDVAEQASPARRRRWRSRRDRPHRRIPRRAGTCPRNRAPSRSASPAMPASSSRWHAADWKSDRLAGLVVAGIAADLLHLGVEFADGDAECRRAPPARVCRQPSASGSGGRQVSIRLLSVGSLNTVHQFR